MNEIDIRLTHSKAYLGIDQGYFFTENEFNAMSILMRLTSQVRKPFLIINTHICYHVLLVMFFMPLLQKNARQIFYFRIYSLFVGKTL